MFLSDAFVQGNGWFEDILIITFQNINAITTAGYNTVPLADVSAGFAFIMILLMIIGGAPSGTAGGLKLTTVSATYAAIRAFIIGDNQVRLFRRSIPLVKAKVALATTFVYMSFLFIGFTILLFAEPDIGFKELLFEATSGLGTVGLTMGITGELGTIGKLVITCLMYAGRVGVLTVITTMVVHSRRHEQLKVEDVAI